MALYPAYPDDDFVPEYVRASTTTFPIEEQRIDDERYNTDHADALSEAILYRGPTGSPYFREWVNALLDMRGRTDTPVAIFAGGRSAVSNMLSTRWRGFWADYEVHPSRRIETATLILNEMYAEDRNRASSAGISNMIEHLLRLQSLNRIGDVDRILGAARTDSLAPEFLVGLLRINFPLRRHLKSWDLYYDKVEAELTARNVSDPSRVLRGLRAT